MAVQMEEVHELVDFAPEGFLVTSFYLDVNADEFPDSDHVNKALDSLMHTARERRDQVAEGLAHDASESLRTDLDKIESYVKDGFDRTDTNALAVFSCSAHDFWQVIQMPTAVVSRVTFAPRPQIAPIAAFLSHNKPTAILLADRQEARIFTMSAGEVREWADINSFVPSRSSAGGWSQSRYERRRENFARHNIDHAAELVLKLKQHYPFDWLILGAEVQTETELKADLHPYLKDVLIGTIHVRIDADAAEVVEKAREVAERAETELIDTLISQIQEYAGAGGRGTIGLDDTLQALNEQKVHILLVQDGYRHAGSICANCGILTARRTETCPGCGEGAEQVDNVVDAAVQRAYELGSTVEVALDQDKLEPVQNIASIMYY